MKLEITMTISIVGDSAMLDMACDSCSVKVQFYLGQKASTLVLSQLAAPHMAQFCINHTNCISPKEKN